MLRAMSDPSDAVLLDASAAYPAVLQLRAALARRDWAATRVVIESAPADVRCLFIRVGSDEQHLEDFLRQVLARDPEDSMAAAMLGLHLTDVGWKIRTGARADHVSSRQFSSFFALLRTAEQVLIDGAARHPEEPAIWVARLISARGLQLGLAETRRRYDRLRAVDPHNYLGQTQYLQALCPKWSGSWEQLHPWALQEMLAAPPGALAGALVAEAHVEHWLDLDGEQERAYLAAAPVRDELVEAAHRSIWHPEFGRAGGWVQATSAFAMAFSLVGDQQAAAASFSLLGNLAARFPFQYLGGELTAAIRERRARAYAAAGAAR
jgi:hypothetical protein